jgi:hypothetical protein
MVKKGLLAFLLLLTMVANSVGADDAGMRTVDSLRTLADAMYSNDPGPIAEANFEISWEDLIYNSYQIPTITDMSLTDSDNSMLDYLSREKTTDSGDVPGKNHDGKLTVEEYLNYLDSIKSSEESHLQEYPLIMGEETRSRSDLNLKFLYEGRDHSKELKPKDIIDNYYQMRFDSLYQSYFRDLEDSRGTGPQADNEIGPPQRTSEFEENMNYSTKIEANNALRYIYKDNSLIMKNYDQFQETDMIYSNVDNDYPPDNASSDKLLHSSISGSTFPYESIKEIKSSEKSDADAKHAKIISSGLDLLIRGWQSPDEIQDLISPPSIGYPLKGEISFSSGNKKSIVQNYAVVVGVDNYEDRMSLHTCANDAEAIADILKSFNYNVILLSDKSDDKPTKSNILNIALREIRSKPNLGSVIFYFSGHGEEDDKGNYYLIPKDANGDRSSCISEYDLKQYLGTLKNLAIIIDACNSGKFADLAGDGQMVIASSKQDQRSNELWFGSMSLFTSNLCKAIREEEKVSTAIALDKCFERARVATERASSLPLTSQTPQIEDKTGGNFFLSRFFPFHSSAIW